MYIGADYYPEHWPRKRWETDARLMKEMGVTAVRNAHYPQSENWHAINDREGVLLWDELSLVNVTRDTRAFWYNSEECLREMKLRVSDQVGLVNLNLLPMHQNYSGVCQDAPAIGAMAARLVIEKLNHNERGIPAARMTVLTDGYWFEGQTLRKGRSSTAANKGAQASRLCGR